MSTHSSHPLFPAGFPRLRGRVGGFTVLELILALLVMAVLALLLLSGVGRLRDRSDTAECVSRLRRTGAAILLYAADHRNNLPGPLPALNISPAYTSPATEGSALYTFLWSYLHLPPPPETGYRFLVAEPGVCPRARGKSKSWLMSSKFMTSGVHWSNLPYPYEKEYPGYPRWDELPGDQSGSEYPKVRTMPFGRYSTNQNLSRHSPWAVSDVPQPSRLALIGDTPGNLQNPGRFHETGKLPPEYDVHCNILFLDGHIDSWPSHPKP